MKRVTFLVLDEADRMLVNIEYIILDLNIIGYGVWKANKKDIELNKTR